MAAVEFKNVWEKYQIKFVNDKRTVWEDFWALKDINFELEKGQCLGIIGENGSGKSTILKLVAGMLKPDKGEVKISGKVSGLLELGAGFQIELTGKENIHLNAGLFGMTRAQIEKIIEEIMNFANIGRFIDAPVKFYSQGMFVRLAFSIAVHTDPDILLIDDILSVGDEYFQGKCIKKILEIKEQNKTVIFVTHDMNMLKRLTKRALFLKDGKILKDDVSEKVLPLYTQLIGSRNGVGILERAPLKVVFNNGRLFLNWKNKVLTSNSGAYASFVVSGKWYSSIQADWEVKKEGENKLIATGRFYQIDLTQTWKIELNDDYSVKWDIEMECREAVEITEGYTNVMLADEYSEWFTALEEGKFPVIELKNKNPQVLLDHNIFRKCIGVKAVSASDDTWPSIAFEQFGHSSMVQAQILNSDYLNNCRILQYRIISLQNYSATVSDRFAYFSGKLVFDLQDIDSYISRLRDELSLANNSVKIGFDNGRLVLSYNGMILTKGNHAVSCLYANNRWYFSSSADWDVVKEGNGKLIARGTWEALGLTQIWEIELTGESTFLWKINMELLKNVDIEQQHILFTCSSEYRHWFNNYASGTFPDRYQENQIDVLQRCVPDGVIGLQADKSQLPGISLRLSEKSDNFGKIINSDFYQKARILRIDKVEPEEKVSFSPNSYNCFEVEARLNEGRDHFVQGSTGVLEKGGLKFTFDNGKGRIYWNGLELTKRLSLYTSLRSQGRWYDSVSAAFWNIEEINKNFLRASGKWLDLPIKQHWEITLKNDSCIDFNIGLLVDDEVAFDRLQTNLMLSELYREWLISDKIGEFPLFEGGIDDDWQVIISDIGQNDKNLNYVGVSKKSFENNILPTVKFYPVSVVGGCLLNIVNSDIYHRGRVLQCLNNKNSRFSPGEYPYFSGSIQIL